MHRTRTPLRRLLARWLWSRRPDRALDAVLRWVMVPATIESSRRLIERLGPVDAPTVRPPCAPPVSPDRPQRRPAGVADPFAPLAPPSPRVPTQMYGTPPRGGALGRDPFAEGGEG